MARVTASQIRDMKNKKKFTMLTAYDYPTAKAVDESGIEIILVGDSLGNAVLGYENSLSVTMEDMIHHTKAVSRAARNAMVVGDMPFLSYHVSLPEAVKNAGRFVQEGGAQTVKIEGGVERVDTIKAILDAQIPVMGHLGFTPQSVNKFGGYKVQGKDIETANKIIEDAKALDKAGVFSIVLEMVPTLLAKRITEEVSVPTIGIGAGHYCDGQVLVVNDLLGIYAGFTPKFAKKYANLQPLIMEAFQRYKKEVEEGSFPGEEHGFGISDEVLERIY